MANEQEDLITLLDEDGTEHRFSVQDVLDVDDQSYFVLLPEDDEDEEQEDEEELEYLIFRVETVGDEDQLVLVDDDEELERVAAAWAELDEDWDETES